MKIKDLIRTLQALPVDTEIFATQNGKDFFQIQSFSVPTHYKSIKMDEPRKVLTLWYSNIPGNKNNDN